MDHKVALSSVALDLGIPIGEARHLTNVYRFMMDQDDTDREHWSYYDEFLKSNRIKKVREEYAAFDEFIVKEVKGGTMPKALELRDKLPVICSGPKEDPSNATSKGRCRSMRRTRMPLTRAVRITLLRRSERFREWVVLNDTEADFLEFKQVHPRQDDLRTQGDREAREETKGNARKEEERDRVVTRTSGAVG